jgi:hypothetical protein
MAVILLMVYAGGSNAGNTANGVCAGISGNNGNTMNTGDTSIHVYNSNAGISRAIAALLSKAGMSAFLPKPSCLSREGPPNHERRCSL